MNKLLSILIFVSLLSAPLILGAQQNNTFDYTKIGAHPRILMDSKMEDVLRKNMRKSDELKSVHKTLIEACDKIIPMPPVEYKLEGKRLLDKSREALRRVFFLSYGYRMTKDKSYLKRAEVELNNVCDFTDWNPKHFLDVGEMTMAVAIGYDWLYDALSPELRQKIETSIVEKGFEPSLDNKLGWFVDVEHNWNQVCNAGMVYGALAIFDKVPQISTQMIERCMLTNLKTMNSYRPDGAYPEGYNYWGYGTTFEVMLIAALDGAFGHDGGLAASPGFLKTAEYLLYMTGTSEQSFNYSDCASKRSPRLAMFWFAEKLKNPSLLWVENEMLMDGSYTKSFEDNRLLPAFMVFARNVDFSTIKAPKNKVWTGDGAVPVTLVRTGWDDPNDCYLGIKGGSASVNHGHMDAGSFVFDSGNLRWAADLGMQNYYSLESKGIVLFALGQDSPRWSVFRYQNKNHNTLTINNRAHKYEGFCPIVRSHTQGDMLGADVDMSQLFEGQVESAMRRVVLEKARNLVVIDTIRTSNSGALVRWSMVTPAKAQVIDDNSIRLEQKGKSMILRVESSVKCKMMTWSTEPTTNYDAPNPGTIIVGFEAIMPASSDNVFKVTLTEF